MNEDKQYANSSRFQSLSPILKERIKMLREFAGWWNDSHDESEVRHCAAAQEAAKILQQKNRVRTSVDERNEISERYGIESMERPYFMISMSFFIHKFETGDTMGDEQIMKWKATDKDGIWNKSWDEQIMTLKIADDKTFGNNDYMKEIYGQYIAKYGKPTEKEKPPVQLSLGGEFDLPKIEKKEKKPPKEKDPSRKKRPLPPWWTEARYRGKGYDPYA